MECFSLCVTGQTELQETSQVTEPSLEINGIRSGQDLTKLNFAIGIWRFGLTNLGRRSDWSFLNFPAWWSSAKGVHLLLA